MNPEKSRERFRNLTLLSASERNYPSSPAEAHLEAFDNVYADRDYIIEFDCPEYTSLCPVTGQPDFGHIIVRYVPDKKCIESKSLKLYLYSFRNTNTFHEESVNTILDAVVNACSPRRAEVIGRFRPRGGIAISSASKNSSSSKNVHTAARERQRARQPVGGAAGLPQGTVQGLTAQGGILPVQPGIVLPGGIALQRHGLTALRTQRPCRCPRRRCRSCRPCRWGR